MKREELKEEIYNYIDDNNGKSKREKYFELKSFIDSLIAFQWVEIEEKYSELYKFIPTLISFSNKPKSKRKIYSKELGIKDKTKQNFNIETSCGFIKKLYNDM